MGEMTEKQRAAYEAALARSKAQEQQREEVPTQRLRQMGQGLTFGTADEIEARAMSLATGRPYEEVLSEIRGRLKAYKEARPIESTAYEIGGAAIPALIPGGQSSLVRAAGDLRNASLAFPAAQHWAAAQGLLVMALQKLSAA